MVTTLPLLVVFLAAPAGAQPDPLSPEAEVLAAQQRRYQAMIDVDVAALEALLADDLRFTHADGKVESKYEFIASLESRNLDYQAIEESDTRVRIHGPAAVVTGETRTRLVVGGERRRVHLLFTAVYVRGEGGWRLVVYQSTEHPDS